MADMYEALRASPKVLFSLSLSFFYLLLFITVGEYSVHHYLWWAWGFLRSRATSTRWRTRTWRSRKASFPLLAFNFAKYPYLFIAISSDLLKASRHLTLSVWVSECPLSRSPHGSTRAPLYTNPLPVTTPTPPFWAPWRRLIVLLNIFALNDPSLDVQFASVLD